MDLIKSKFPEDEVFNKALMEVQLAALRNRDERKEKLKHQLIEYPERAAKRKIAKNENRHLKRRKNFWNLNIVKYFFNGAVKIFFILLLIVEIYGIMKYHYVITRVPDIF